MISYWSAAPHQGKGSKLKLKDIMEIPLLDEVKTPKSNQLAKVKRMTPEEIEKFHAGTWEVPEDIKNDNSATS